MDFDPDSIAKELNSGYWKVLDKYFFNKAEALRYASASTTSEVTYHYFDNIFSKVDWSVEPQESLQELYKQRAQQIRDKYQYVILAFSGGADSTNVVKTFINNKIFVDEIVTAIPEKILNNRYQYFNKYDKSCKNVVFEYYESVVPLLKWVKEVSPSTKISVVDYLENMQTSIYKKDINILDTAGIAPALIGNMHYSIFKNYDNILKDCCVVYAVDKPNIHYNLKTNTFETYFLDFLNLFGKFTKDLIGTSIPKTEYFYYTSDFPKLLVKQCHVLALNFFSSIKATRFNSYIVDINTNSNFSKNLLYGNNWDIKIYQADKTNSNFYNQQSDIFWNTLEPFYKTKFEDQLSQYLSGINKKFILYLNNKPNKFIPIKSKFYSLNKSVFIPGLADSLYKSSKRI